MKAIQNSINNFKSGHDISIDFSKDKDLPTENEMIIEYLNAFLKEVKKSNDLCDDSLDSLAYWTGRLVGNLEIEKKKDLKKLDSIL
jgi:hypothetical protein